MTGAEVQDLLRLVAGFLCGAAVGLERQLSQEAAGLRTHMLVAGGACAFMLMSIVGFTGPDGQVVSSDRIASTIVTGIGFIGAGAIWRSRSNVHGLTTAASIWVMAAIGMLSGSGHFLLAGATTVLVIVTLRVVHQVERWQGWETDDAPLGRDADGG